MLFTVTMVCDNAAFELNPSNEIARILYELANKIDSTKIENDYGKLRDINGNTVGKWECNT